MEHKSESMGGGSWVIMICNLWALGTNTSFEGSLDTALLDFIDATGLDHLLDASEGLFEAVEGGRVDHLLLDTGGVGTPAGQEESGPVGWFGSLSVHNILIIVDGVTAVIRFTILDT